MSIEVRNNAGENRYEAYVDGELAGVAVYARQPGSIVFEHTEVDPQFEGRGVGSALAKGALEDVRAQAEDDVIPRCPFIKEYIDRHAEFADLVHRPH